MHTLARLWHFFTDPHFSIIDIEQRRQSRLLAGLMLSLLLSSLLASALLILSSDSIPATVLGLWVAMILVLGNYFLNRAGHYRLSAVLFVLLNLAVTYSMPILSGELAWLFFGVMVVLLCAILLPDLTAPLFLLGLGLQILLGWFHPMRESMSNIAAGIVYMVIGPLILVFMNYRAGLEEERQKELQAINESLRHSEAQLESRVIGRTAELRSANEKLQGQIEQINALQARLREEAIRDPLTGLFNRRYLEETLVRELGRARREGYGISFMLLDIDYFKSLNDTYGHEAGDLVLKFLSQTLVGRIRTADIPCRIGGEEFLLVLPGISHQAANLRAEYFRSQVQELSVQYGDKSLNLTISVGVAFYPENGESWEELYRAADQALYRAKQNGRNRVETA